MVGLLQSGHRYNVNALARACRVTRRTVFRDLEVLKEAGLPLSLDEESGCYFIAGTALVPADQLTAEEALAVVVLCHELGAEGRLPFLSAAVSGARKLQSDLPPTVLERLRRLTDAIEIRLPPVTPQVEKGVMFQLMLDAISERRCVRIEYDSFADQREIGTKLSPYKLLFSRHSWYVIGRSSAHSELRTFNLARLNKAAMLEETFELPKHFRVSQYLANAWHLIPEDGPDQHVVIRFQPLVARNVTEVRWHPTQHIVPRDDGSVDYHVTVSGLNEITWWILGYGPQAEVLEPLALRERIRAMIQQMQARYDNSPELCSDSCQP